MSDKMYRNLPAYWWVDTTSGRLVIHAAATFGLLENVFDKFFSRWGLSQTKMNALLLLYKNGSLALWELGQGMLVSRANITGLMDRLEKSGLVTRKMNPVDRRSLTARLTPKAEKLVEEIFPQLKAFTEQVISGLTEEEKELFIKLSSKIQQSLSGEEKNE